MDIKAKFWCLVRVRKMFGFKEKIWDNAKNRDFCNFNIKISTLFLKLLPSFNQMLYLRSI